MKNFKKVINFVISTCIFLFLVTKLEIWLGPILGYTWVAYIVALIVALVVSFVVDVLLEKITKL